VNSFFILFLVFLFFEAEALPKLIVSRAGSAVGLASVLMTIQ
jgi:hypothetical protein